MKQLGVVILYVVLGLIGVIVIYCLTSDDIKSSVANIVLWITAIIVLAYTVETHKLRRVSSEQLSISSKALQNELLPIIIFPARNLIQGDIVRMQLKNIGKGPVRNLKVTVEGHVISSRHPILPGDDLSVPTDDDVKQSIEKLLKDPNRNEINASITYYDIYERCIEINGLVFHRDMNDPRTRFVMDNGTWKYLFHF